MNLPATDLSQRPPRSSRCRLGNYALLPRALDKCRATLAGINGPYHYNCPLDQQVLSFAGIDAEQLKQEVASGKSDGEILEWIKANEIKRSPDEIAAWSAYQDTRRPDA